jgi:3-deoxy-manno-octulosonate cytidylyltransferase (CMP-KDO synthetase)
MKYLAVIPARYEASRFPGKLMQLLGDKTVITQTWLAAKSTGLFDEVIVATDNDAIRNEIESYGGIVKMTRSNHESGSDRIAEAIENIDAEVIVNVQGDTPFINRQALEKLLILFDDATVQVGSLMDVISDTQTMQDPNVVKVCVDNKMNSLLFSRSIIPYPRNTASGVKHYRHIGVYAFRKAALLQFVQWPVSPLEDSEKLECLRFLENGLPLKMALTEPIGIDINMPDDLIIARTFFK